jgi:hypothetical protein
MRRFHRRAREALDEIKVRYLDAITVDVLRHYLGFLIERDYAGKTIETGLGIVYFLLKKNGVAASQRRKRETFSSANSGNSQVSAIAIVILLLWLMECRHQFEVRPNNW